MKKYFGIAIEPVRIQGFEYQNGNFIWPAADGMQYWDFAQVENFYDNGDGTYTSSIKVFEKGFELETNDIVYEPMLDAWGASIKPEYSYAMEAVVKKAVVDGKNTYQLLKYSKIY